MKRNRSSAYWILLGLAVLPFLSAPACADEGMWTFNNVPKAQLKKNHGFAPTESWLDHLRWSSVRFNNGGSGSFVSPSGLVMTNHHVAADCLQKLGTADKDYYKTGFYAASPEQEVRCADLELNVLAGIEEVTTRVNSVVKDGMNDGQKYEAQRGLMSIIEKECAQASGLRCDVVTLYQGGVYNLYKYRKYTDVRLVFSPEMEIAFFGGDPDNFTFPRYDLDVTFFRVYEEGKPLAVEHFLRWSTRGAKEGDLVFIAGHPGSTNRMHTLAQLEYQRSHVNPFSLDLLKRRQALLQRFSQQGEEEARIAKEELFGLENSLKARVGFQQGLSDPVVMKKKMASEKALREAVAANPEWQSQYGKTWDAIAEAQKKSAAHFLPRNLFDRGVAFDSQLFSIARHIVRLVSENQKPNDLRLREYSEANLPSLELELYSPAPVYGSFEQFKLTDSLQFMVEKLGMENELVRKVLAGKSPAERAKQLVSGSRLQEVPYRKELVQGGLQAVADCQDPVVALARAIDPESRELRKNFEDLVQGVERANHALLATVTFKMQGTSVYPDATFTLRLSFGPVKGYAENGKTVAPFTDFAGLYRHSASHGNVSPYHLPESWVKAKPKLNLSTPFNFVSTGDIIGGNSGSPVVNTAGEVVGLIFDGNIQSLVWNFLYDDRQGRAVSVDSRGLLEALERVYSARRVVEELKAK
jgi:hypothetical protein